MEKVGMKRKRETKGRQKIEMKLMENKEARYVCFSKRRVGLFKKAHELSIQTGAQVGAIVFSLAGKPFTFGNPSLDTVIDRFNGGGSGNNDDSYAGSNSLSVTQQMLSQEYKELCSMIETEKRRKEALEEIMTKLSILRNNKSNLEDMGFDELLEFEILCLTSIATSPRR